jgi:hypothetical protein
MHVRIDGPRSRDTSVGVATGYGLDGRDSNPGPSAYPASYSIGNGGDFPGIKRPGREAGHSPPFNVEVINGGAILPLPHTSSSQSTDLTKHRDTFTVT